MADRIRINTDRLGTDAGRIQDCIEAVIREIDEMRQSAAALERMWEGSGREAFGQAFREDLEAAEHAVAGLKEIYAYDTNAKQQYEQRERKIASLLADIRG